MKIIEKFGKDIMVYKVPEFINKNKNTGNKLDDFEILGILDEGKYSKVVKVKSKINFGIYAMKKIFKGIIEYHNLKKDIYFIVGEKPYQEYYRVTGYDIQSSEGVGYITIDPVYEFDLSAPPEQTPADDSADFFWFNGGVNDGNS